MDVLQALELRRSETDRVAAIAGGLYRADIQLKATPPAGLTFSKQASFEGTAPLSFAVRFTEMPMFSSGWSMAKNQVLYPGASPRVDMGVYIWKQGRKPDSGGLFYDGATIAYSVTGPTNLVLLLHLVFVGKALVNPAGQ